MESHPITPRRTYFLIFLALLVLLAATVGVASLDFGPLNYLLAVTIAAVKAYLVLMFFMGVRHSSKLTRLFAAGGLIWLLILILPTIGDYITRVIFGY